ncbi:sigma-70 family RNA polymerase sigma factor [Halomonas sp. SH5A2]|uniref:RNA polymerase sigma factor n=1 Tax=Halomonas sp. SH5A2 TaxID=2749040 RepID=UPI00163FFDF5|nr:RNA polymerase sigma factor [Halomonas sp. SH5A2]QNI03434.1 sigma-70 family RNA polymerase sigma factor [Halomonas sp. SH5A2]
MRKNAVSSQAPPTQALPCIEEAWNSHHQALRYYLLALCNNRDAADDILQRVYVKALTHRAQFCQLSEPKAWLYKVAKHEWIDELRRPRPESPSLGTKIETIHLSNSPEPRLPLDSLAACIAQALAHCADEDADIVSACDLNGVKQSDYAQRHGLTLPATKARLLRARKRLRARLVAQCGVVFDDQGQVCCHRALPSSIQ